MTTESNLEQLFDKLPPAKDSGGKDFKVRFNWGNQNALNLFLSQFKEKTKYPLIWLIEGEDTEDTIAKTIRRPVKLFIAKQSTHQTNTNPIIWDSEFKNTLDPIYENVKTALISGGNTNVIDRIFKAKRLANFSDKDTIAKTIDPWNVIIVEFDLETYTRGCINENITFKNI